MTHPDNLDARVGLAKLRAQQGRTKEAIDLANAVAYDDRVSSSFVTDLARSRALRLLALLSHDALQVRQHNAAADKLAGHYSVALR